MTPKKPVLAAVTARILTIEGELTLLKYRRSELCRELCRLQGERARLQREVAAENREEAEAEEADRVCLLDEAHRYLTTHPPTTAAGFELLSRLQQRAAKRTERETARAEKGGEK